jgi:hypothetical protein
MNEIIGRLTPVIEATVDEGLVIHDAAIRGVLRLRALGGDRYEVDLTGCLLLPLSAEQRYVEHPAARPGSQPVFLAAQPVPVKPLAVKA